MTTKEKLLAILKEHENEYVSGQDLANVLKLSRNSIWKASLKLKEMGYRIESTTGLGYRLLYGQDVLSEELLKAKLQYEFNVKVFDTIDSTNSYGRSLPVSDIPTVIVSDEQTGGRGRLGRDFYSPKGAGLYMTFVTDNILPFETVNISTILVAVAVSRAIDKVCGVKTDIKWVNDIYLNGKKIAGILTEGQTNLETGTISRLIFGVGINCFESNFPEDIKNTAGIIGEGKRKYSRNELCAEITNNICELLESQDVSAIIKEYRAKNFVIGKNIYVFNPYVSQESGRSGKALEQGIRARAVDIDSKGGLVVEFMEGRFSREMQTLRNGEVTIRTTF